MTAAGTPLAARVRYMRPELRMANPGGGMPEGAPTIATRAERLAKTVEEAVDALAELAQFNIEAIEQPIPRGDVDALQSRVRAAGV